MDDLQAEKCNARTGEGDMAGAKDPD